MTQLAAEQAIYVLQSNRLSVEVAVPGTAYAGSRFDWTGFILQVTLDGVHTFCTRESFTPGEGTGGVGLCNEFGIQAALGYDRVAPGEQFLKLGVGLCTRLSHKPYNFFTPYPVDPCAVEIAADGASITYTVQPRRCAGYAARLTKRLSVTGAHLAISYTLENVGERPIHTDEYCHNFLAIDGEPFGPAYRLRLPEGVRFPGLPPTMAFDRGWLRWQAAQQEVFYCPRVICPPAQPVTWELRHEARGVGVRGTEAFPVAEVALFGTAHLVSPECFVHIAVAPGATERWERRYTFFAE